MNSSSYSKTVETVAKPHPPDDPTPPDLSKCQIYDRTDATVARLPLAPTRTLTYVVSHCTQSMSRLLPSTRNPHQLSSSRQPYRQPPLQRAPPTRHRFLAADIVARRWCDIDFPTSSVQRRRFCPPSLLFSILRFLIKFPIFLNFDYFEILWYLVGKKDQKDNT